jgi:hypothetical protein
MAETCIEVSAVGGNSEPAIGRHRSVDSLTYWIESRETEPGFSE